MYFNLKYLLINTFLAENLCELSSVCSHICKNSPDGFMCLCPENMILQNDNATCLIDSPCNTWGLCSQKCMAIGKYGHKCACNDGYLLSADHFTCKSIGTFKDSIIKYKVFLLNV